MSNKNAQDSNEAVNGIDQIRELVFGEQIREYNARFDALHEYLENSLTELRRSSEQSLLRLESFIKSELKSIDQRLATEENSRVTADDDTIQKLDDYKKHIDQLLRQLRDGQQSVQRNLREEILVQSRELENKYKVDFQQVNSLVEKTKVELEQNKIDSQAFAHMLSDVAKQLNPSD